jgi:hypothetical protein
MISDQKKDENNDGSELDIYKYIKPDYKNYIVQDTGALDFINEESHKGFSGTTGFHQFDPMSWKPTGNIGVPGQNLDLSFLHNNDSLSTEEIERIVEEKISSKKDDVIKRKEIVSVVRESLEVINKQKDESLLAVDKKALDIICKELLGGKTRDWRCAKCGRPLEIFSGEEGFKKMKDYLSKFRNNIYKKCSNGHENWFELKEDGINWIVKVIYGREFR